MTSLQTVFRLNLYDSLAIVPLQVLTPGKHEVMVAPFANSLLSTLWVKSVDVGASVSVKYYDYGAGPEQYPGEKVYLQDHLVISTNDVSDRIIVSKIHNKAIAEITITGGNAELCIFVTSVSSFPVDAPYKDGAIFNVSTNGGNANVVLDPTDGKFYIWQGTGGSANVNITGGTILESEFDVKILTARTQTTVAIEQTLIDQDVPAGKAWRLRSLKIISRCYGKFVLLANNVIIGEGATSPAETNIKYDIFPYWSVQETLNVKVKFIQNYGPNMDISAYLQLTEQDI